MCSAPSAWRPAQPAGCLLAGSRRGLSRAACWYMRPGRPRRRRCKASGKWVVSHASMRKKRRGPWTASEGTACGHATPVVPLNHLDTSFWQWENEAHLGQPVRAFPRGPSRARPGARRRHRYGKLASFDAACHVRTIPPIDEIVADPAMRSTAHRPASRWRSAALIAASRSAFWARPGGGWGARPRRSSNATRRRRRLPLQQEVKPPNRCLAQWHRAAQRRASHRQQPPQQRAPRACLPWTNRILSSRAGWRKSSDARAWHSCASTTSRDVSSRLSTTSGVSRRRRGFGPSTPRRAVSAPRVATDAL